MIVKVKYVITAKSFDDLNLLHFSQMSTDTGSVDYFLI